MPDPPARRPGTPGLCRQPLAPFGAATVENDAAALGRHAGTEAVTAGAHKIARLESTLHGWSTARSPARSSSWALALNLFVLHKAWDTRSLAPGKGWAAYRAKARPSQLHSPSQIPFVPAAGQPLSRALKAELGQVRIRAVEGWRVARDEKIDLCIIGAGPAGIAAAERAAALGRRVVLVEAGEMGGVAHNWGALPAEALAEAAERAHQIRTARDLGLGADEPRINFLRVNGRIRSAIEAAAPTVSAEHLA